MGKYTEYIWEYLQEHAEPGERITNIADMTEIARRSLFEDAPLELLSDTAQNFVTQFTLHYMQDEFGCESESLWKIELNEKLYNNYEKINFCYDNLQKQFYDRYEKSKRKGHGTRARLHAANDHNLKKHDAQKIGNDVHSGYDFAHGSRYEMSAKDAQGYANGNKNITDNFGKIITIRRDETHGDTGKELTNEQSKIDRSKLFDERNNENGEKSGATIYGRKDVRDNKDKQYDMSNEANNRFINEEDTDDNRKKFTNVNTKEIKGGYVESSKSDDKSNSMSFNFDAPSGSLSNIHNPDSPPGGTTGDVDSSKGIGYIDGREYKYFSAADERDATTWKTDKTQHIYGIEGENEGKYEEIASDKADIDGETNYDKVIKKRSTGDDTATINRQEIKYNADGEPYLATADKDFDGDLDYVDRNSRKDATGHEETQASGTDSNSERDARVGFNSNADISVDNEQNNANINRENNGYSAGNEANQSTGADSHIATDAHSDTNRDSEINDQIEDKSSSGAYQNSRSEGESGNENEDRSASDFENINDDNDEDAEKYIINFNSIAFDNSLMNEIWDIFDDLFMMIY